MNQAQISNKVFSPQNWLKSNASVQGETLLAGTVAAMLPGFQDCAALLTPMQVPDSVIGERWSAE